MFLDADVCDGLIPLELGLRNSFTCLSYMLLVKVCRLERIRRTSILVKLMRKIGKNICSLILIFANILPIFYE